jgi:hypothetical protein
LGKLAVMTGSQLTLRKLDEAHKNPNAKYPFTPQRKMVLNLQGDQMGNRNG